jgi:hypothetical protein
MLQISAYPLVEVDHLAPIDSCVDVADGSASRARQADTAWSDDWASKGVPHSIMLAKPFAPAQLVTALANLLNAAPPAQAE